MKKCAFLICILACFALLIGCNYSEAEIAFRTNDVAFSDFAAMNYSIAFDSTDGSGNLEYAEKLLGDLIKKLNIENGSIKLIKAENVGAEENVIILGGTDCDELGYNDIKYMVNGNSIRILAKTKSELEHGIDYFSERLIDSEAEKLMLPAENALVKAEYPQDSFKICGVDIGNYVIKSDTSKSNEAAKYLREYIGNLCGAVLDIVRNTEAENYILLGSSVEASDKDAFIAETNDGILRINAADLNELKLAVQLLMYKYTGSIDHSTVKEKNVNIELESAFRYDYGMIANIEAVSVYVACDALPGGDGSLENPLSTFAEAIEKFAGYAHRYRCRSMYTSEAESTAFRITM